MNALHKERGRPLTPDGPKEQNQMTDTRAPAPAHIVTCRRLAVKYLSFFWPVLREVLGLLAIIVFAVLFLFLLMAAAWIAKGGTYV